MLCRHQHIGDGNGKLKLLFPDKVIFDVDVLVSLVVLGVLQQVDCHLVVDIQWCRLLDDKSELS